MSFENRGYDWPGDHQAACVLSVDVDEESPYLWRTRSSRPRGIAELELRRFGPRQGIARLLDLFERHGVTASFFVPGYIADRYPDLLPTLDARGHELGLHGYLHEIVSELTPHENREVLERSCEVFERQLGFPARGYRSPAWDLTPEMPDLLAQAGVEFDSSLMGYDHPYEIGDLVEIPVSWFTDDATFMLFAGNGLDMGPPTTSQLVVDEWRRELDAAVQLGSLAVMTIHPWVVARGARITALEEVIEYAQSLDIWITTAGELADYHRRSANAGLSRVSELDEPGELVQQQQKVSQ